MTNEEKKAYKMIMDAAEILGWSISFDVESDNVDYMILGTSDKIEQLLNKVNAAT